MNTIFSQPAETGIAGKLFVPVANKIQLPAGQFGMVLWQSNPFRTNGLLVANGHDYEPLTGFAPADPGTAQRAFRSVAGSTVAQMEADIVGAYANSADLPNSPAGQKFSLFPQFNLSSPAPAPFASGGALTGTLDLQIPTATGDDTYALIDHFFIGPNGVQLSFGIKVFGNAEHTAVTGSAYDPPSNSYMLNSAFGIDARFVTAVAGAWYGEPWVGFRTFRYSISTAQFAAALEFLRTLYPTEVQSLDPGAYSLTQAHLNAEFHFNPAPASLGWSMRGWDLQSG